MLKFFKEITGQVLLLLQHQRIKEHRAKVNQCGEGLLSTGIFVFLHAGSLVTLSAIHNFTIKDAEKVLVKKGNFFPPFCWHWLLDMHFTTPS